MSDPSRPIIIRMNGWVFYENEDDFFNTENPFGKHVADIVMVNAYSNVEDYYSDFVDTVTSRAIQSIKAVVPNTKIIISLGTWEELPLWHKPKLNNLKNDFNNLNKYDLEGIAYFKYGAKDSEWYLPDNKDLWRIITKLK